ncbi:hypothetical protein RvY_08482 [Ramazzottius varieornatus]|uniref:Uncharacterized protein n=1 Tax=Ramazzottius varieornatus TaxID=947166 RepID=A0A1D1V5X8_RAMVA|nr:hypothetical protein RvY_08482 [Ramazzottius varieornatus]
MAQSDVITKKLERPLEATNAFDAAVDIGKGNDAGLQLVKLKLLRSLLDSGGFGKGKPLVSLRAVGSME